MYQQILKGAEVESASSQNSIASESISSQTLSNPIELFDVYDFISDLEVISQDRNQKAKFYSNNINAYDLAHNCIREIIFKIQNVPVENYKDVWLPIMMRATLGNAVHDFLQTNCSKFTENEVSIKIPSKRISVRVDSIINDNVLVEIKSCTYSDYSKIIKTRKPRDEDFYQAVFYKYLLENHLQEAKQQTNLRTQPPKLDSYNIKYIQLIYVAHDIISSDCKSISESLEVAKTVKQMLNSKYNQFHYITPITLNIDQISNYKDYETYIISKLNAINYYLDNNIIPPMTDPYICPKSCYFCVYKKPCKMSS